MDQPRIALTMGDPAGIGPEVAAKAWSALRQSGPAFMMVADPACLDCPASTLTDGVSFADALPVLPISLIAAASPGAPDPRNARATVESIEVAVRLALTGKVDAIVTNPINKAALYQAGFAHPGHTEFLAELTGGARPVMMLTCPQLSVVPVTIHTSLRAALDALSTEEIVAVARIAAAALRRNFGFENPRLAVAGLNPHAGEGGALGREELSIIQPAIDALRAEGLDVSGPWSPDAMFTEDARALYDVAIGMYHDQVLIPLKTLDVRNGVNVTLGLPIVRTSPDHGTAYDIAGQGVADASSLIAAIRLAHRLADAGGRSQLFEP
jgi:4-hydroxythreonine-4-phosphate dehydrogenase